TGRLSLGDFYIRRARRLLPASYLMTVLVVLVAWRIAPDDLPRLRDEGFASIAYLTNWELIESGKSYFADIARQPLLLHLWSLAIEEQYYLLWAPVVFFLLPRVGRKRLGIGAAVLAVASVGLMAFKARQIGYPESGADPTRLYFGTDTHGFALIIGSVLGMFWRPNQQQRMTNPAVGEGVFLAGLAALAGTVAMFVWLNEAVSWLYPWGFLLSAMTSAVLIAAATYRSSGFGAFLDQQPLRWLGERSYGIYLWHWPIFMLTRPDLDLRWDAQWIFLLRVGLTLGISAVSYTYVEQPIRHGLVDRLIRDLRSGDLFQRNRQTARTIAVTATVFIAIGAVVAILITAPNVSAPAKDVIAAMGGKVDEATAGIIVPKAIPTPAKPDTRTALDAFYGPDVTAIGDSVLLGASATFTKKLVGSHIYAKVGWQAASVLNQIQALVDAKALTPVVLVHLGTNGYVTEEQLRKMLSLLADRKRVLLVNSHVPRRWMDENNNLMEQLAREYPNVVLIDWRDTSEGQPDFFVSDGVHLTVSGMRAFVGEIMREGHLAATPDPKPRAATSDDTDDLSVPFAYPPGDLSKTLVRLPQKTAPDTFWQRMAACETSGNWTNKGQYSGGLAIYVPSWTSWGGAQFAATPDQATPAQQIAVANRIATQGWAKPDGSVVKPVGYAGWGCTAQVGRPVADNAYTFTPESVIRQQFHFGERGEVVRDLQLILGMPRDGIYGWKIRGKHVAFLKEKGLPSSLAAPLP
ncbi:MAG: acyltransferase family protein, partial [Alphaproteobacteria bacterium]|nr:acyltransferase family protein [Alphaproteobacteria bacterium]